jgi:hypothetical protein
MRSEEQKNVSELKVCEQGEDVKKRAVVPYGTTLVVAACLLAVPACTSGARGTYSDATGSMVLELKSGSKANFTYMGDVADCSYSMSGKQVTVNCRGSAGTTVFNVHDDGSLSGPPGTFIPVLRRQK